MKLGYPNTKKLFDKGCTINWTIEVFKITTNQNANSVTYLLEDNQGNPIKGGFHEYKLQKTKHTVSFFVQNILRRKGKQVLVKWQ